MPNNYPELLAAFQSKYPESEAKIMYEMLLEHLATEVASVDAAYLQKIRKDIESNRPIQYLIGKTYFADMEIAVAEGVLIPRPETDELVYWINQELKTRSLPIYIWDIGTGSGCIALGIKNKNPEAQVYASDWSEAALRIAAENAARLDLPIHFFRNDILQILDKETLPMMDVIVSNPPYIVLSESAEIAAHVKDHEPAEALFVTNEDPLQFYKAIEVVAAQQLSPHGCLYLELHSLFAQETQAYYESKGWNTLMRKDMQEKERMLRCIK